MRDEEKIALANKASRLLNDVVFLMAFDGVRQAILLNMENCSVSDKEGLHELKLMLKLLKDLKANIEAFVADGKLSAINIEREKVSIAKAARRIFNLER